MLAEGDDDALDGGGIDEHRAGVAQDDVEQHLGLAGRADAQVFVCVKSPVMLIDVMSSVDVPVFVMVTVWAGVVEPTVVFAKVSVVGVTVTEGA